VAERRDGVPTSGRIRERITTQLATAAQTGIALLPICRHVEGDFIAYCRLIVGCSSLDEPEIAFGRGTLRLLPSTGDRFDVVEMASDVADGFVSIGRRS
jgi:hypothetical protein